MRELLKNVILLKILLLLLLLQFNQVDNNHVNANKKCLSEFRLFNQLIVSGNYATELGSNKNWDENEKLGIMHFDENACYYVAIIRGLTPKKKYEYKVGIKIILFIYIFF